MKHLQNLLNWNINYDLVLFLTFILIVLKGLNIIYIPWYWVLCPVWLPLFIFGLMVLIWMIGIVFLGILEAITYNKYKF